MPGATYKLPAAFVAFGVVVADGAMNAAGSNPRVLTSATAAFTIYDVGKRVKVEGAGAAGADLDTRIARRLSPTQVELDAPALTTVAGSDISYAKGVYRLSILLDGPDVDGVTHGNVGFNFRRMQLQLAADSPGGTLCIGGPNVSTTNRGVELANKGDVDDFAPGYAGIGDPTQEWLCSGTANQLVNVYWIDPLGGQ